MVDLENKSLCAHKMQKLSFKEATDLNLDQLNAINEFHLEEYERSSLYKERLKYTMTGRLKRESSKQGICYYSLTQGLNYSGENKVKMFHPFKVTPVFASRVGDPEKKDSKHFKVNRQHIKHYIGQHEEVNLVTLVHLYEV